MDKNTFTGLFLIMVIMGASIYFMKPNEAEIKKEKERVHLDSLKKAGLDKDEKQQCLKTADKNTFTADHGKFDT
jgi:YidC/Oxa1 family membrane protein insertase